MKKTKKNILFQGLLCLLVLCASLYIGYVKNTSSVQANAADGKTFFMQNITFSHLADRIEELFKEASC